VPSLNVVYTQEEGYVTADVAKAKGLKELKLSGTKFRQMLRAGEDIPEWFAFKSVVQARARRPAAPRCCDGAAAAPRRRRRGGARPALPQVLREAQKKQ